MTRFELRNALLALGESQEEAYDWAYKLADGKLRCPDCNADQVDCHGMNEGPLPWSGAVKVTTETCADCGVVLSEDPASSPAWIGHSVLRSQDMFGPDSVFGPRDYTKECRKLLAAG